jgi:uncharacterized membrane protein
MCWKPLLLSILGLILVDLPYLTFNKDLYMARTNAISGAGFTKRYYSALIVYLALGVGITMLAVPNIRTTSGTQTLILDAIRWGGLFGITAYATFDFTTHFMFEGWDLTTSLMDTVWGGILCSIVAGIVAYFTGTK